MLDCDFREEYRGRRLYIIWLIIVIKLHTFMHDIPSIQKLQFEIIYQIFTSLSV